MLVPFMSVETTADAARVLCEGKGQGSHSVLRPRSHPSSHFE